MAGAHHGLSHNIQGRVGFHRSHIQTRYHNLSDGRGVQPDDGAEHLPVPVIETGQLFRGDRRFFKLVSGCPVELTAVTATIAFMTARAQCRMAVAHTGLDPRPRQSRIAFGQEIRRAVDQEQTRQQADGHKCDDPPISGRHILDQRHTGEDNSEETGRFQPEEELF